MDERTLRRVLARVKAGEATVGEAVAALKGAPFERMGDLATLDTHRALRHGMPEVVLGEGKTAAQVGEAEQPPAHQSPCRTCCRPRTRLWRGRLPRRQRSGAG